jgi:hypothetical protein
LVAAELLGPEVAYHLENRATTTGDRFSAKYPN